MKIKTKRGFNFYRNLTFTSLLIGYAGYYICRQNLSVAYLPLKQSFESQGIDLELLGWLGSIGTFTYALGKVFLGPLTDSKRWGGKRAFLIGLICSVFFSLLFGLGRGITVLFFAWGMNRFFQALGWGGLVHVISRWFTNHSYGTAMGLMSMSYQFGGVLATLYAAFILNFSGGGWRHLFIIPAITLAIIGVGILPFLFNRPQDVGFKEGIPEELNEPSDNASEGTLNYLERIKVLIYNKSFIGMAALSFILTFIRECFNLWMPIYFSELDHDFSMAAFKSAVFPLLGCIGTLGAGWFSDRYLQSRRAPVMATFLAISVGCLFALSRLEWATHNLNHYFGLQWDRSSVAVVFVGAVGFFLLGAYSLVGGVVALDFGGKKTAGTAAGLLDGVGYLGAALSGIGIARLVIHSGWNNTFFVMGISTIVAIFLCFYLWRVKPV